MSPLSPPFEALGKRPFSFYPAILNIEHNEWLFRKATWSEILVYNPKADLEVWIPRRFIGEISSIEDPVVIAGLVKELEYKGGAVWPYQRRVIEMPVAVGSATRPSIPEPAELAPVVGIRVAPPTDSRILRLIGGTMAIGFLACIAMVFFSREGSVRQRVNYTARDQSYLELTAHDDYNDVIRKLGSPSEDRWQSATGEIQYRALHYHQRSYIVILMGTDRNSATYIGTLDSNWYPVHSVQFRTGGNTFAMLRGLKRF